MALTHMSGSFRLSCAKSFLCPARHIVDYFGDDSFQLIHLLINSLIGAYSRYVGNLDPSVTEELLVTLFGNLGSCKGCKIIREVS